MKKKALAIFCGIVAAAIIGILIWGRNNATTVMSEKYNDGVEQIDINTIYLENSGVEVDFSEVLLGSHEEMRKLIVSTQEATVSTELADKLIQKIDFDFLKKSIVLEQINYVKVGPYISELGGLDYPSTNQHLYTLKDGNIDKDITHYFWRTDIR